MTRREKIRAFLIGMAAAPIFGIVLGYDWITILIFLVAGGPIGVLMGARAAVFRDVFGHRESESLEGVTVDSPDEPPAVSRARVRLGMLAIVAGVASAIIVALIMRR